MGRVAFPYVPGLLAFRDLPAVLAALGRLRHVLDLVVRPGPGPMIYVDGRYGRVERSG